MENRLRENKRSRRDTVRILIVEDEAKVSDAIKQGLEAEGYAVSQASTGEEGFFLLNQQPFDLVILDLMLPNRSGMDVLATMRARGLQVPALVLTAKDTVRDRVQVLDLGADDYLVKPFAFPELVARVRALIRRGRPVEMPKLRAADLEVDVVTHKVSRGSRALHLTAREFEIIEYLLRRTGAVVSREMLAREVWKTSERATPLDNAIDVTMARLRRKLDEPSGTKLLHTVRGLGYRLGPSPE